MASSAEAAQAVPPPAFHGVPAEELTSMCFSLGLTMKTRATGALSAALPGDLYITSHPAITLRPITSVPAAQFEDLQNKQPLWNLLIDLYARHPTLLSETLRSTAASDAAFTGRLLSMYERIYLPNEANQQRPCVQPAMLGVFRNDFMEESSFPAEPEASYSVSRPWKQVEINTISCSFAGLSPKVGVFHNMVAKAAENEVDRQHATALAPEERVHISESGRVVPAALAAAVRHYQGWAAASFAPRAEGDAESYVPVVCYVLQENERNTADQYALAFEVEVRHGIRCLRRTLREIHEQLVLVPGQPAAGAAGPVPPRAILGGQYEVALFYFRSCYTPKDFVCPEQWAAREAIEVSAAVKCPSLPHHLCTFKKVQQVLTGSLLRAASSGDTSDEVDHVARLVQSIAVAKEKMLCVPNGQRYGTDAKPFGVALRHGADMAASTTGGSDAQPPLPLDVTVDVQQPAASGAGDAWLVNWIRSNFVPIYSLNEDENPTAEATIREAVANPHQYVLKPQLEGGGNLFSGDEMVELLRIQRPVGDSSGRLNEAEQEFLETFQRIRREYILMRRIAVKKHSCDEVLSTDRSATGTPHEEERLPDSLDDDASPLFRLGTIVSKRSIRAIYQRDNEHPNDDLCSELGIFGVILSSGYCGAAGGALRLHLNDSAGYVVRSKLASVDDGGVMAGAAFLDSLALIE